MNAFVIDAFEFCRISGSREGVTPVAEMTRLTKDCADQSGSIAWKIVGGTSKTGFPTMTMSVTGTVQLICQRCLTPYAHKIDASTLLMLGKDDDQADEIEEMLDDETIDVIVGSRTMNVADLVEDEALLALPHTPKHGACPDTSALDALKVAKKSPFDALKGLKPE